MAGGDGQGGSSEDLSLAHVERGPCPVAEEPRQPLSGPFILQAENRQANGRPSGAEGLREEEEIRRLSIA